MASTRNKNTKGNYELEQRAYQEYVDTVLYENYGKSVQDYLPGDGLGFSKMAPTELSNNPRDIESFLFGIGENNLVTPKPPTDVQLKKIKSLDIFKKTPIYLPKPMVLEENRPVW